MCKTAIGMVLRGKFEELIEALAPSLDACAQSRGEALSVVFIICFQFPPFRLSDLKYTQSKPRAYFNWKGMVEKTRPNKRSLLSGNRAIWEYFLCVSAELQMKKCISYSRTCVRLCDDTIVGSS